MTALYDKKVGIVGAGLAGSEAALFLSKKSIHVTLFEMRDKVKTHVHKTNKFAELVCSNSFKSTKENSAAGLLKVELDLLGSSLFNIAKATSVDAGGALAVDRELFSNQVTKEIQENDFIDIKNIEVKSLEDLSNFDAIILATGPMTSDSLASYVKEKVGQDYFHFYDAAAPIVEAESLDLSVLFQQNRYEDSNKTNGDYLNAPFEKEDYDNFINELTFAKRVILKDFENKELFQACQPIEEIAKKGHDAPRFGAMKPVGIIDPRTNRRPWAVVQLRAENEEKTAYNLVGFQTNLTFSEQKRVFSMIPGLKNAEFSRYGVMHKNLFLNAPSLIDSSLICEKLTLKNKTPIFVAGQFSGTEGYVEAIRSGLHAAISVECLLKDITVPSLPAKTIFGALINYATNPKTEKYQPMHVNFGILPPLEKRIKNKGERYLQFAKRANDSMMDYKKGLEALDLI